MTIFTSIIYIFTFICSILLSIGLSVLFICTLMYILFKKKKGY